MSLFVLLFCKTVDFISSLMHTVINLIFCFIVVRMETQKEMQKFEKYQRLVEDYISLSDKVIAAKKVVLHDLKYSNIFYNAQLEDAKKVAHVSFIIIPIFYLGFTKYL